MIDRGTHGWVGWVEQQNSGSTEMVHDYFRSAGALVCLAHLLGGTDLHSENLIASSEGPVLVDTEMLLQPSTRPAAPSSAGALADEDSIAPSRDSCLVSGLVSLIVVDRSGTAFDVGGLQPAASRDLAVPMRRWLGLRRDDIRFVPEHRVHPVLRNDLRVNDQVQRPEDFVDDLCAGFEATYRFLEARSAALLAAGGPLSGFADCRARVLFRPSDQYAAAQYLLAAPRYQRRGLDRSLAIEMFGRVFVHEIERPRLWPLAHDERQALEALDIPRVTLLASGTDLEAGTGETVHAFYAQSGVAAMRRRLAAFSAGDLAYQIDQLRTALGQPKEPVKESSEVVQTFESARHGRPEGLHDDSLSRHQALPDRDSVARSTAGHPVPPEEDAGLRAAAERVGVTLLGRAQQGPDGVLRWPSSGGRADLYSGVSGIGLFLAALAVVTGHDTWRDAARQALRGIGAGAAQDPGPSRIGICSGLPSVAYAVALAGHLLEDERMVARAGQLASAVSLEAIDSDDLFDIEGGAAGALIAFLAIHQVSPDDRLIAMAARCVSRLLATQIRTGPDRGAWPSGNDSRPRPGFAHGAAGIACALSRWTDHAADVDAVFDVVRDAWGFERRTFAANNGAWPTVRRDGGRVLMAAWCHGAPGIALARASAPVELADPAVAAEIDAAMSQTLSAPEAQLDHLCCGNLGRAEVALTVGRRRGAGMWVDRGLAMSRAVAARVLSQGRLGMRGRGFHCGAPAPEFFQGLAGIGYQLLRASSPAVLPSVLAFEPPGRTTEYQSAK